MGNVFDCVVYGCGGDFFNGVKREGLCGDGVKFGEGGIGGF